MNTHVRLTLQLVLFVVGISLALNIVFPFTHTEISMWLVVIVDVFICLLSVALLWIASLRAKPTAESGGVIIRNTTDAKITDSRREQLEALLAQMPEGVVLFEDWNIVFANRAAASILGFDSESFILGRPILDFVHSSSVDDVKARVSAFQSVAGGNESFVERNLIRADGSLVTVEIAAKKMASASSLLIQIILRDLTEKNTLASELQVLNASLKKLSKRTLDILEDERKMLAYELHDEIGQTFASMALRASLVLKAEDGSLTENARGKIVEIKDESVTASKRTRLLAQRIMPPQLTEHSLEEAVTALADSMLSRSYIRWNLEFDQQVDVDDSIKLALYRIIQEALTNVTKHADAEHVSIVIKISEHRIQLSFHDNGQGIEMKKSSSIHGLGWQSIKDRVELLNGSVKFDSKVGIGTHITVMLPLKKDEKE